MRSPRAFPARNPLILSASIDDLLNDLVETIQWGREAEIIYEHDGPLQRYRRTLCSAQNDLDRFDLFADRYFPSSCPWYGADELTMAIYSEMWDWYLTRNTEHGMIKEVWRRLRGEFPRVSYKEVRDRIKQYRDGFDEYVAWTYQCDFFKDEL